MSEPSYQTPPPGGAKSQATMILILGILGVICCGLLAPVAWVMGNKELKAIRAGQLPATNEGMTRAGQILGIIGTILLIFGIIWVVFFGGMAILSGMSGMAGN
jgi:uncharacterized membrane protein YjgN (DUF898 family)